MNRSLLTIPERMEKRRRQTACLNYFARAVCVWLSMVGIWSLADVMVFRTPYPVIRWGVSILVWSSMIGISVSLILLWRRRRRTRSVAQSIDAIDPTKGFSVVSAVDFAEHPNTRESTTLRNLVIHQTRRYLKTLPENCLISRRSVRNTRWFVGTIGVIFLVTTLFFPDYVKIASGRISYPWREIHWPKRTELAISETSHVIIRGQPWRMVITDAENRKLPTDLYASGVCTDLSVDAGPHPPKKFPVDFDQRRSADGKQMILSIPYTTTSFELNVMGGDDRLPPFRVKVEDPVRVTAMEVRIHPPEYTGLTESTYSAGSSIPYGSRVTIHVRWSRPICEAVLWVDSTAIYPDHEGYSTDGTDEHYFTVPEATGERELQCHMEYRTLSDAIGNTEWFRLPLRKDTPPTIVRVQPESSTGDFPIPPDAVLNLFAEASDDYGVTEMSLEWSAGENRSVPEHQITMRRIDEQNHMSRWSGNLPFSMEELRGTGVIAWRICAKDGTGQRTLSPVHWFTIVPKEFHERFLERLASATAADFRRTATELTVRADRIESMVDLAESGNFSGMEWMESIRNVNDSVAEIPRHNLRRFTEFLQVIRNSPERFQNWLGIWRIRENECEKQLRDSMEISTGIRRQLNERSLYEEPETVVTDPTDRTVAELRKRLLERVATERKLAAIYREMAVILRSSVRYERIRMRLAELRDIYGTPEMDPESISVQMIPEINEKYLAFTGELSEESGITGTEEFTTGTITSERMVVQAIQKYRIAEMMESVNQKLRKNQRFGIRDLIIGTRIRLGLLHQILSGGSEDSIRLRRLGTVCDILRRLATTREDLYHETDLMEWRTFCEDEQKTMPATIAILCSVHQFSTSGNDEAPPVIIDQILSLWNGSPEGATELTDPENIAFQESVERLPPDDRGLLLLQVLADQYRKNAAETSDPRITEAARITQRRVADVLILKFPDIAPTTTRVTARSGEILMNQADPPPGTEGPDRLVTSEKTLEDRGITGELAMIARDLPSQIEKIAEYIAANPADVGLDELVRTMTGNLQRVLLATTTTGNAENTDHSPEMSGSSETSGTENENMNRLNESISDNSRERSENRSGEKTKNATDDSGENPDPAQTGKSSDDSGIGNRSGANDDANTDPRGKSDPGAVSDPTTPGDGRDGGTVQENTMDADVTERSRSETSMEQVWGELPGRVQRTLKMRRAPETFHPLYQRETEAFFRRLLEEYQTPEFRK
ncbi:MAG: hypothetical protein Q4C47_02335 [Planctomycetia bacterium]|nr:hypothetical protein [Planctomycetia bacterium]